MTSSGDADDSPVQIVVANEPIQLFFEQPDETARDIPVSDQREVDANRPVHGIASSTSPTRSSAEATCPGWLPNPIRM